MSRIKEPHYFSVKEKWALGPAFHNALFASNSGKTTAFFGESSTTYAASDAALRRIKDSLTEPKIVFMVREPVERAISHYRWMYALGLEKRSWLDAFEHDGFGFDPDHSFDGNYKAYLQFSSYSRYLPRWFDTFGRGNVMVLFTDELAKSPLDVVNRCFKFLQLEPLASLQDIHENRTQDVKVRNALGKLVSQWVPSPIRKRLARNPHVESLWKLASRSKTRIEPPVVTEEDTGKIAALLGEEIDYFNLLRRDFGLRTQNP